MVNFTSVYLMPDQNSLYNSVIWMGGWCWCCCGVGCPYSLLTDCGYRPIWVPCPVLVNMQILVKSHRTLIVHPSTDQPLSLHFAAFQQEEIFFALCSPTNVWDTFSWMHINIDAEFNFYSQYRFQILDIRSSLKIYSISRFWFKFILISFSFDFTPNHYPPMRTTVDMSVWRILPRKK